MFEWFERRIDPFAERELETPPATFRAFCWHYTKPVLPILVMVAVLGAMVALVEVAIFSYLGDMVNWLDHEDPATFLQKNWFKLLGMSLVLLLARPALEAVWNLFFHQALIVQFSMSVRWRAHRYLLRQSMSFYQDEFAGRIANKLMQTALGVREVVSKIADILVYVLVYFAGGVALVFSASAWLALPFLVWLVFYVLVLRIFIPRIRDLSIKRADASSVMMGHVVDAYTNISTVKLFSHAAREEDYGRKSMAYFMATVLKQMRVLTMQNVCLVTLNVVLLFVVAAVSIVLWQSSAFTTGDVAIAIALALRMQNMSHWIMWEMAGLFENVGTVQDGIATISRARSVVDDPDAKPLKISAGEVHFDRIGFHYGKANGVIDDLDLMIRPGEKIGLVGRSGAGKSTLINLLLRFYDLEKGRVLIDGQDISLVGQDDLRSQIGVVTQDTSLLHRSIFDNVAYGRPEATVEEVEEALRKAHAFDFIGGLSDKKGRQGLHAHVGERGVKLSGGQRQRIAIARVLLKDAPLLLLDEATSALDSEVEQAIQESLFELMEGKTVIAIAHRLSTIAAMDRLIVMDKGRIIEEGTHDELLTRNGLYAQLWAHQSGGFLETDPQEQS